MRWYTVSRFIESTDDAFVGGDITVLAPKVPGFIAQVAVTDNQSVRAGDLLVRLDDRDFVRRWSAPRRRSPRSRRGSRISRRPSTCSWR